jgi:hypothetical protein
MDTTGRNLGYWAYTGVHNEWTTVTFEFDTFNQKTVTSNGAYQFCFGVATGAYIDDVSLETIPSVTSLVLNATELSLRTGKKYQMTYTMSPSGAPVPGGTLTWSSDTPDVVSVTADGELFVRGNAGQSAIITLSNPCIAASCLVTIPTNDPAVDAFFKKSGVGTYTVTYADTDQNQHMNNTRYADMFAEFLPMEGMRIRSISISYLAEAPRGEVLRVFRCERDGVFYLRTVRADGKVNSEAEIELAKI